MSGTEANNMTFDYFYGDSVAGDGIMIQKDGTPPKIYKGGVEVGVLVSSSIQSPNKYYFGNQGASIRGLLAMEASCFVELFGDSSGDENTEFFYGLWQLLAAAYPDTVFLYNDWSNTTGEHTGYSVLNASSYTELRGIRPVNTIQKLPYIDINTTEWASPDLDVSVMVSDFDFPDEEYLFTCVENDSASLRSYEIKKLSATDPTHPAALYFRFSTGAAYKTYYFDDFFLGETGGVLLRIQVDADDGAGNHIVRAFKSPDNEVTWNQFDEQIVAGTVSINKPAGAKYVPAGVAYSAGGNAEVTIHRVVIRDGIDGRRITFPTNIESLKIPFYDPFVYTGKPVCYFVNNAVGGYSYDDFDDALILATGYPDENPLCVVNMGHNDTLLSFNDLYAKIESFIGRIESHKVNPTKYFTTQHPWRDLPGDNLQKAQRSHTQPTAIRSYCHNNNCGYIDTAPRIYNEIPNWQDEMNDSLHPGPVIQAELSKWHFEYWTR